MAVAYLEALSRYTFLIFHFYPVSCYFFSTLSLKQSTTNNCSYFTAIRCIAYSQKKASIPTIERVLLSFNVVTSIVYNPLPAMWKS